MLREAGLDTIRQILQNYGVGLAREEFIVRTFIKIHPLALLEYQPLQDIGGKAEIDRLMASYSIKHSISSTRLPRGRHDWSSLLPRGRHRPHERIQVERICQFNWGARR